MNFARSWHRPASSMACDRTPRRRGFALIAVLWLLLILSVIGAMSLRGAESERDQAALEIARFKARLIADAAINRAIMSVINAQDPLKWRLDGTAKTVDLLDHQVQVAVESEAAKIDLNQASHELLAALLRTNGVDTGDAADIADRIVAWRSPLTAGEPDRAADRYIGEGRPYVPTHSPFRSVGELRLVLGMTDALQSRLVPAITVYSRSASVDRQVAGDLVLRALEEQGDSLAADQREARDEGQAAGLDRFPALGEALRITCRVENGQSLTRSAVIRLTGDKRTPYWILDWQ